MIDRAVSAPNWTIVRLFLLNFALTGIFICINCAKVVELRFDISYSILLRSRVFRINYLGV